MLTLPYPFDTSSVRHTILKGALVLNAVLVLGILFTLFVSRERTTALGLVLPEVLVRGLTLVFVSAQTDVGDRLGHPVGIEPASGRGHGRLNDSIRVVRLALPVRHHSSPVLLVEEAAVPGTGSLPHRIHPKAQRGDPLRNVMNAALLGCHGDTGAGVLNFASRGFFMI